jgi:large subunit ribosomal protein L29
MTTKDITALTKSDLHEKLKEERELMYKMKFNHTVTPIENPNKIKASRKLIARFLTEINRRRHENANTNA